LTTSQSRPGKFRTPGNYLEDVFQLLGDSKPHKYCTFDLRVLPGSACLALIVRSVFNLMDAMSERKVVNMLFDPRWVQASQKGIM
jgi:hypothetical protein